MLRLCRQEADDMRDVLGREEVDAVAGVGDPVGRPLEGEVALQLGVGDASWITRIAPVMLRSICCCHSPPRR
jgi:hypothetical protein